MTTIFFSKKLLFDNSVLFALHFREETMKLTSQIEQLQKELDKSNVKLSEYNNEVKRWKAEANKSPSVMQRQLAERLRTDLLEKDKQIRVRRINRFILFILGWREKIIS